MGRTRVAIAAAIAVSLAAIVAGCGDSDSGNGPVTLKFYGANDPNQTNVKAMKECSAQSKGRYTIELVPLANNADASRELLVRRLAAKDSDIDLINMDTIWTPEFAEAGWLRELKGDEKAQATDDVLPGPLKSVEWKDGVYAVPLNTNAQLLWYRKDLVPEPPETWDEMIAMAKKLPAGEGLIQEQGNKYEGYVVWFNNLVASAGGTIVEREGRSDARRVGREGGPDHEGRRHLGPCGSRALDQPGGPGPARVRGRPRRLHDELAVRLRRPRAPTRRTAPSTKKVYENMGWARWPGVEKGKPSRVSIGGANIGISKYGRDPALATAGRALHDHAQVAGRRRRSTRACRR